MTLITFSPCEALKPYIKYIAISEAQDEHTYKVLPGTSLVSGFQYKGALGHIVEGAETRLSVAGITGLQETCRIFRNAKDTGTVLIYFTETGASFFFNNALHELFDMSLSMDLFFKSSVLDNVSQKLAEATSDVSRVRIIEEFFLTQKTNQPRDKLVDFAIEHILKSKGSLRIRELARALNISQSPLEKRFRRMVGTTPKKFSSIVRIRSVLNDYASAKSFTSITYDAGYFDQAHFIHDFKKFTGETPESFFSPQAE